MKKEHILVGVSSAPSNAKIIRAAARMAKAYQGSFTALYVETPNHASMTKENKQRLQENLQYFEFQSTNEGIVGLKRFRTYESQMSYKYKKAVTTYVLFSGSIKNPMTEFTEGINTYRVVPIIMQDKNADKVITELKRKQELGEKITKADLLPLVLCPLMSGTMSQKERVIFVS